VDDGDEPGRRRLREATFPRARRRRLSLVFFAKFAPFRVPVRHERPRRVNSSSRISALAVHHRQQEFFRVLLGLYVESLRRATSSRPCTS